MLDGMVYEKTRSTPNSPVVHLTRTNGEQTLCGLIAYAGEENLRPMSEANCQKCLEHHAHYVEEDEPPRQEGYVYVIPSYGEARRTSHYVIGSDTESLCRRVSVASLRCERASPTVQATCKHCRTAKELDVDDSDLNWFFDVDLHAKMNRNRGGARRRSWDRS